MVNPSLTHLELLVKLGIANDADENALKLEPLIRACKENSLELLKL